MRDGGGDWAASGAAAFCGRNIARGWDKSGSDWAGGYAARTAGAGYADGAGWSAVRERAVDGLGQDLSGSAGARGSACVSVAAGTVLAAGFAEEAKWKGFRSEGFQA